MTTNESKISDLNDYCLEKIFRHLDVTALFNVAVANEWLRPIARLVYWRKFGHRQVCIKEDAALLGCSVKEERDQIVVNGLKMCLQYLRCLDSAFSNLCIRYNGWNEKQCHYIHQYLNRYCAESLVQIEFRKRSNTVTINSIATPFVNVRKVEISGSSLDNQFLLFPQWFPNLRTLFIKLHDVHTLDGLNAPFQHLEELSIDVNDFDEHGFTAQKAVRLVQLCPRLHTLNIFAPKNCIGVETNALLDISGKGSPTIRNLRVMAYSRPADEQNIRKIIEEHPALVELALKFLVFTADNVIALIRRLDSLQLFEFEIANHREFDRMVARLDYQWDESLSVIPSRWDNRFLVKLQR